MYSVDPEPWTLETDSITFSSGNTVWMQDEKQSDEAISEPEEQRIETPAIEGNERNDLLLWLWQNLILPIILLRIISAAFGILVGSGESNTKKSS